MARLQLNFSKGLISQAYRGLSESQEYMATMSVAQNVTVNKDGSVGRRPGVQYATSMPALPPDFIVIPSTIGDVSVSETAITIAVLENCIVWVSMAIQNAATSPVTFGMSAFSLVYGAIYGDGTVLNATTPPVIAGTNFQAAPSFAEGAIVFYAEEAANFSSIPTTLADALNEKFGVQYTNASALFTHRLCNPFTISLDQNTDEIVFNWLYQLDGPYEAIQTYRGVTYDTQWTVTSVAAANTSTNTPCIVELTWQGTQANPLWLGDAPFISIAQLATSPYVDTNGVIQPQGSVQFPFRFQIRTTENNVEVDTWYWGFIQDTTQTNTITVACLYDAPPTTIVNLTTEAWAAPAWGNAGNGGNVDKVATPTNVNCSAETPFVQVQSNGTALNPSQRFTQQSPPLQNFNTSNTQGFMLQNNGSVIYVSQTSSVAWTFNTASQWNGNGFSEITLEFSDDNSSWADIALAYNESSGTFTGTTSIPSGGGYFRVFYDITSGDFSGESSSAGVCTLSMDATIQVENYPNTFLAQGTISFPHGAYSFQGRQFFYNSLQFPATFWGTVTDTSNTFSPTEQDSSVVASNSVDGTIATYGNDQIFGGGTIQQLLTFIGQNGVYRLNVEGNAITPEDIAVTEQRISGPVTFDQVCNNAAGFFYIDTSQMHIRFLRQESLQTFEESTVSNQITQFISTENMYGNNGVTTLGYSLYYRYASDHLIAIASTMDKPSYLALTTDNNTLAFSQMTFTQPTGSTIQLSDLSNPAVAIQDFEAFDGGTFFNTSKGTAWFGFVYNNSFYLSYLPIFGPNYQDSLLGSSFAAPVESWFSPSPFTLETNQTTRGSTQGKPTLANNIRLGITNTTGLRWRNYAPSSNRQLTSYNINLQNRYQNQLTELGTINNLPAYSGVLVTEATSGYTLQSSPMFGANDTVSAFNVSWILAEVI